MERSVYRSLATFVAFALLLGCGGNQQSAQVPTPTLTVTVSAMAFGNQLVDTTSNARVVMITNSGSTPAKITSATLAGAQANEYTVTTPAHLPLYLAPNFSVSFQVTFTPKARGSRSATLTLGHNAADKQSTVSLTGNGVAPAISVGSNALEFGTRTISGNGATAPVTVTNTGDGDLVISNIGITGNGSTDFQVSAATPLTVAAGSSTTVNVTFKPTAPGQRTASLSFTDNAGSGAHEVAKLSGAGVTDGPSQPDNASVLLSANSLTAQANYPMSLNVQVDGSNTDFVTGATVANFGPGVAVGDGTSTGLPGDIGLLEVIDSTHAVAHITIDQSAAPGPRTVMVQTGGHESLATIILPSQVGGPAAHASALGNIAVGETVYLDGSTSTTAGSGSALAAAQNADIPSPPSDLAYHWKFLSLPSGSTAALSDPESPQPSFVPDLPGTYVAQLTVGDGTSSTSTWVILSTENSAPNADAGPDQFVARGDVVHLNGSGSTDADGDSLIYQWTLISAPSSSNASLSDATDVSPFFTVDSPGTYVFRLDVNDSHGNTATDTITVSTEQAPPVARIGNNQKVAIGSSVEVDGSKSYDPDGDSITCNWQIITKPSGSTAQLSSSGASSCSDKPSFTADQGGTYVVQLGVSDNNGNTSLVTTLISTGQVAPVANAGNEQNVGVGQTVLLDGSSSFDPDGDPLTYSWSFLSRPSGSTAALSQTTSVHPAFLPDVAGQYVIQLIVSDGTFTSRPGTILVSVGAAKLQITPTSIPFGNQNLHSTSDSLSILVKSTGGSNLVISAIDITGTNAADFAYTAPALPITVPSGSTATVNVTFSPSAAGARGAVLTLTHNAGTASQVSLSGTGTIPAVSLNPTSLTFSSQLVNTESAPQDISVKNTGTGTLSISNMVVSGDNASDFSFTPDAFPINIEAGKTAQVSVIFKPVAGGVRSAVLKISDNVNAAPESVSLTGTATAPAVSVSPGVLDFHSQPTGESSNPVPLTIANNGTADLVVSALIITGTNASEFALANSPTLPLTIAPAQNVTVNLVFTPSASGNRTASLAIAHNAQASPLNVTLGGTGTAAVISPDPSPVNFGDQLVGSATPSAQILKITNTGSANLVITGIAIAGTNAADFTFGAGFNPPNPGAPITVQPGNSTTVPLSFRASAEGARSASLAISGNATATVTLSGNGVVPHISVTPNSIPFGNQQVDAASTPATLKVKNTGNAPLVVSSVQLTGSNAGDFQLGAVTTPFTVASNDSVSLTVLFKPTVLGSLSAQLSIASNATEGPATVTLSGTGTGVPPQISPSSIVFNDQLVGTTSSAFTVSINNLHSTPLTVSNVELLGANPGDFSFSPATTSFTVPADGSASLSVRFTPSAGGTRAATLRITDNTGTHDVPLSGNGTAPAITTDPVAVTFAKQLISTTSQPATVTLTNSGTAPLLVNSFSLTGANSAEFSISAAATPFTLQPQQSATVQVKFNPATVGSKSAALVIADNTAAGSHSVPLTGTATAPSISIAPGTLAFGNQIKGKPSTPQTLTISNDGTGDLLISNIGISGPHAADFSLSSAPAYPITVPAGTNATVGVVFTPSATGAEGATLTITSNASQKSATLTGTGTAPQITLIPAAGLPFGNQLLNKSSDPVIVTIGNTGTSELRLSNVAFTGTNAADFSFDRTLSFPIVVPINGATTFGVIFTPKALGARAATLAITDDAAGSPHTLPLSGTGVAPSVLALAPLDFGDVNVGSTSSSMNVTITNQGGAPLHISALSFTGPNASEFFTNTVAPMVVAANGGTATIAVRFSPKAVGSRAGTLVVTDDADGSPHTAALSGNGVGVPIFHISPTSVDFGNVTVDDTSTAQTLVITNLGTANMVIDHLVKTGANGGDFLYTVVGGPDFPQTVAPGMSLTVYASFKPTASGSRSATLVFQDAAANSLGSISLSGTGLAPAPQISLSTTSLTFAETPTGISSSPLGLTVTNNGSADLTISGLAITGTNASDFSLVQTAPITVTKKGGTAALSVIFKPTALGTRTATLEITNDTGNAVNKATVSLTGTGRDLGRLSLQPATVGKDLELLAIGSVDVAPKNNLSITISSSDPTKLLLSPLATDTNGANAGVASFVGTLPAGKGVNGVGFPAFWIQALASTGTAQITMSAPGYTTAIATVTLTPSGFVLISPLGVGTDFTTQLSAADSNLTVSTARLDAGGNVVITDQKLRGGLFTSLDVVSGTPATGTVSGTPVSFQGGTSSSTAGTVKFHPVAIGTTQLSIAQPAGFTTPASGSNLTATVRAPAITLTPTVVGYNLQVLGNGLLNIAAPAGGLQVTISSSDTSRLLLSTDPLAMGSGSVTVTVPAGTTMLPAFYIQGLTSSGTASIAATATGYSSASANVLLSPSGFVINSPNGGGNFTTTTLSAPTDLTVSVWQLNSSLAPVVAGQIRGGVTVPLEVVSGTTTTGTIGNGTVTFHAGEDSKTGITFEPNPSCVAPCTSVLSVSHTNDYATPVPGGQITASVNKPAVSLRVTQNTIGNNLQIMGSGALDVPAPTDLQVTITSNSPNVLLSASPTAAGSSSLTLTVFQGSGVNSFGFPSYYIQALGDTGTVQLTVSASGFESSSINVTLAPSGFVIEGPNGIGGNFGTVLANGNVGLTVRAAVLNPSNGLPTLLYEPVRGGFSTIVDVISSAPGVATLAGPPLTMTGGNGTGTVTLQPQAPGQTTITIITPAGYAPPSFGNWFVVTVN